MTNYKVTLTEHAKKDIEVIYQHYIALVDSQLADRLLFEIETAITQLATQPLIGHLPLELAMSEENCLELLTNSFRLIYRIENDSVVIIMILHQKQSVVKAATARFLY